MESPASERRVDKIRDPAVWNAFVGRHRHGLALHHLEFLTLLTGGPDLELIPFGIMQEGELEGIYPLIVRKRGPKGTLKIGNNIDFYDGLIPSTRPEHVAAHLELINRAARRHGVGIATVSVFPDRPFNESLVRQLRVLGYEVHPHVSFVIPLKGRDISNIRRFANRRLHRNLEHARKHGVYARDATEQEMDTIFPLLEEDAYRATGAAFPFSPGVFREIWRHYYGDSRFSMRTACIRDAPTGRDIVVGLGLMVDNGTIANFWKLATREEYRYTQSSTLLYWDAVNIASGKGLKAIDTGGIPSRGIEEYKRQWGAAEVEYYHIRSVNIRWYRYIDRTRQVWRRMAKMGADTTGFALSISAAIQVMFGVPGLPCSV